jgi:hypothetical protein
VPRQTLAVWRTRAKRSGPKFVKIGRRIMCRRDHLGEFIDAQTVEPESVERHAVDAGRR